jgi:hypothetical protein
MEKRKVWGNIAVAEHIKSKGSLIKTLQTGTREGPFYARTKASLLQVVSSQCWL